MKYTFVLFAFLCSAVISKAQVLTAEDSLSAGLIARDQVTVLSGYGEAYYSNDLKRKTSEASLKRIVLFIGHKFSNKISLFTEIEVEDGITAGDGSSKGSVGMEQAFLKFNVTPNNYFVAGLFIPRIGIINENHLPPTFNGVERPWVEQLIIPSTWREIGIGFYGTTKNIPGLNYSVGVTNGMNSANFSTGTGIANGIQSGSKTTGRGIGLNASLLYYFNNFRAQVSGYMAGSTGAEKRVADSLGLESGPFANPVILGEANIQYHKKGITVKALATGIKISNSADINSAYANNAASMLYGTYIEGGYDLLYKKYKGEKSLTVFSRYEHLNTSAKIPKNGIQDPANKMHFILAGITYKPVRGVAIKMDYTHKITGDPNLALIVTPYPQLVPYFTSSGFVNLGVAYNF